MSDEMNAAEAVGSAESVGTEESVVGATDAGVPEEESSFFEWTHPTSGEKHAFKNKGELADHLRHSSMFRGEYDQRMKQLEDRAKYLDEQQSRYESMEKQMADSDYMKFARWAEANPKKYELLQKAWEQDNRPADPRQEFDKVLEEKLKPINEWKSEIEKDREERQLREAREAAIERLRGERPDIDSSWFDTEFDRLQGVPEQDRTYTMLRLLDDARRGRESPAQIERKIAASAGKTKPTVTSTPGTKTKGADVSKMSATDRRKAAEAELAAMGIADEE